MWILHEGEKRVIRANLKRLSGSGPIVLTSPSRRILDSRRAVVKDWNVDGSATWNPTTEAIEALFDSTVTGLTAPGIYYMDLRGIVGSEIYEIPIKIKLLEFGP